MVDTEVLVDSGRGLTTTYRREANVSGASLILITR